MEGDIEYHLTDDGDLFEDYEDYLEYDLANFESDRSSLVAYRRSQHHDIKEEIFHLAFNCMVTIIRQGAVHMKPLLLFCLILRLSSLFLNHYFSNHFVVHRLIHILSIAMGSLAIYNVFSDIFMHFMFLLGLFISMAYIFNICFQGVKNGSIISSLVTVACILISEAGFSNPAMWNRIRGVLLLVAMKIISVAIDYEKKRCKLPSLIEYFGYCLHPGSIIYGPWVTLQEYKDSLERVRALSFSYVLCIMKSVVQLFLCLLLSDCVFSYLFIDQSNVFSPSIFPFVANNWMLSYESALSFHFSQYYVSYLATLTCLLSGIGAIKEPSGKLKTEDKSEAKTVKNSQLVWSKFVITKPLSIEIPRSMLNVVVAWNIPMSKWLRVYVFDSSRYLGDFAAVIFTYAASAMLHGLSFHLAAILLSLGFYTYTEHSLRKKLSTIFQCPVIQARPKPSDVSGPIPLWAKLFNLLWVFINIMHLTYLGSMFQYEEENTGGFSLNYTLSKWSQLGYVSHIFALSCFIFNWLI